MAMVMWIDLRTCVVFHLLRLYLLQCDDPVKACTGGIVYILYTQKKYFVHFLYLLIIVLSLHVGNFLTLFRSVTPHAGSRFRSTQMAKYDS